MAVWSPDGQRIAFGSSRDGMMGTYVKNADGSGSAELLFRAEDQPDAGTLQPTDWAPDGKSLVLYLANRNAGNIAIGSLEEDGNVTTIISTPAGSAPGDAIEIQVQFTP